MKWVSLIMLLFLSAGVFAGDDNISLRDFKNVALFEASLQQRQQACLDNSGGGSRAPKCFAAYYQEWDKELNYYYGRLRTKLNDEDKGKLKTAQLAWIKSRDETRVFNSALSNRVKVIKTLISCKMY